MYTEVTIQPAHAGFGLWEADAAYSYEWESTEDLVAEMGGPEWDVLELGVDALPEGVKDIRGLILDEPDRVFAIVWDDGFVQYTGIQGQAGNPQRRK
jgi:hypothetical protein